MRRAKLRYSVFGGLDFFERFVVICLTTHTHTQHPVPLISTELNPRGANKE